MRFGNCITSVRSAVALGAVLAMASAASGAVATWDFQSDTIGSDPVAYEVYYPDGASVTVVDGSAIFGGAGNKSLRIEDNSTVGAGVGVGRAKFRADGAPVTQGSLSMQFYLDGTTGHQGFSIIAADNMWSEIGPWINYFDNYRGFHVQGASDYWSLSNTIQHGTVHTLVIDFDAVAGTFSGTLDGVALSSTTVNGAPVVDAVTVFPFYESLPGIRGVGITSGISDFAGYRSYFDDIELTAVPEPASAGLLALSALALVRRRR